MQRERMLAAALDVVEDVGFRQMTVSRVSERAMASRKSFYDLFADREDCFLTLFEAILSQIRRTVCEAYRRGDDWSESVRLALQQLLIVVEDQPILARVCVVESLIGGARIAALHAKMCEELMQMVELGRGDEKEPPDLTAKMIVGGILSVLHERLVGNDGRQASELLDQIVSLVVLPYRGVDAARREQSSAVAPQRQQVARRAVRVPGVHPPAVLNMRVTCRTLHVLMAIKQRPGSNNRAIADAAGGMDPGQISKLLRRLSGLDLIENRRDVEATSQANVWWLTTLGRQVEQANGLLAAEREQSLDRLFAAS
jgi:AcrR family transcriptional regulator/DNA-binding MarR family transcriptional regulator